jgi:hypothetical protein
VNAAMRLQVGLDLRIDDGRARPLGGGPANAPGPAYPTRRLQRGLLLFDEGQDLAEEGVGFGVPVLKRGMQTVFPGSMELTVTSEGAEWKVTASYRMELVERLRARGGATVRPRLVYAAKDSLAAVHRRVPALRRPLTATSNAVRRRLGWATTYEPAGLVATIPVTYSGRDGDGVVRIIADLTGVPAGPITEVVLMNELGAGHFDRYEDSAGASLTGAAIGTWDEVGAATAAVVSSRRRVAFTLAQAPGSRLLRGREAIGRRLAWAGFGYVLRPGRPGFAYDVRFERRADQG